MSTKEYIAFESNNNSKKNEKSEIVGSIQQTLREINRFSKNTPKHFLEELSDKIKSLELFLPFRELQKGGYFLKEKEFYLPGFGFIEYDPSVNYIGLDLCPHVNRIVMNEDSEELELVSEEVIKDEKSKMDDFFTGQFRSGQLVEIIEGTYAELPARVVEPDEDGRYKVVVCLRSDNRYLRLEAAQLRVLELDRIITEEEL